MRTLRTRSRGPAVQLLQLALNRAEGAALITDGLFGPATREAVRRFQRRENLSADGVAGPETHRALQPWVLGYRTHRVERGDSWWALARRYGSTVEAIALANPALQPENLPVEARLILPLAFPVVPTGIDWFSTLTAICIRGLTARYPFLASGQIGRSVMGKPLWSLRLGQGENRVLYNGEHHANEWITTPLLLRFAEELAAAAAAGEALEGHSAAEILDYASITLIPAVNPDGMDLVTGELQEGERYEQARQIAGRYPRFPFPSGWKANIRGVDLNLQYPALWEKARENKFAQGIVSPAPADFVGTAPLTEPEALAMRDATRRLDPALTLALHSQGEVIYWEFQGYQPPESRQIARAFAQVSGYAPETVPDASGYAGYKDWFLQETRRPGFTLEVGRGVNPLPIGDFEGIYRKLRPILVLAALVT